MEEMKEEILNQFNVLKDFIREQYKSEVQENGKRDRDVASSESKSAKMSSQPKKIVSKMSVSQLRKRFGNFSNKKVTQKVQAKQVRQFKIPKFTSEFDKTTYVNDERKDMVLKRFESNSEDRGARLQQVNGRSATNLDMVQYDFNSKFAAPFQFQLHPPFSKQGVKYFQNNFNLDDSIIPL